MENEVMVYSYRLAYFGGTAPCYDNGVFSLAICKRDMRRVIGQQISAGKKSNIWVVAINGRGVEKDFTYDQINYIARIDRVETFATYFEKNTKRSDCIYEKSEEGLYESQGIRFKHKDSVAIHQEKYLCDRDWDIQHIKSENFVLISNTFTFMDSKDTSDKIKQIIGNENLAKSQGHKKVSITLKNEEQLLNIIEQSNNHGIQGAFKSYQKKGGCGKDKGI